MPAEPAAAEAAPQPVTTEEPGLDCTNPTEQMSDTVHKEATEDSEADTDPEIHTYHAGTVLELLFHPEPDPESPQAAPEPLPLTATILKPFEPFTLSSVLYVRLTTTPAHPLPPELILKLYDKRYTFNTRDECQSGPWTASRERALQDFHAAGGWGGSSPEWFEQREWSAGQAESYIERAAKESFTNELEVYRELRPLQGVDVPRLYGWVEVPGLEVDVVGLAMEYVPGYTLREVPGRAGRDQWQVIGDLAVGVVRRVTEMRVLNQDVRLDNVLIVEEEGGRRAVMIDFGQARVRDESESDEGWLEIKRGQDEEGAVGWVYKGFIERKNGGVFEYENSRRWATVAEEEETSRAKEETVGSE